MSSCWPNGCCRSVTRPFEAEERLVQVGAFLGIAASNPDEGQIPDFLRRADIALDRAKSARSARPIWFDEGMERALIVHSEIEQGIRYGLEHGQFVPFFEPQVDLQHRRDHRLRSACPLGASAERADRARPLHPGRRGAWPDRPAVGADHPVRARPGGGLGSVDQDFGQHLADAAHRQLACAADRPAAGRSGLSRPSGWSSKSPKARCSPTSTSPSRSSPASRTRASSWRSTISGPAFRRSPTCARCRST